jgi:hypothetical protein
MVSKNHTVLEALQDLYNKGNISEVDYYRGAIVTASLMAKDGDLIAAMATICIPDLHYFDNEIQGQMDEDPEFAQVVRDLAQRVDRYKMQDINILKVNQPPAKA